MRTRLLVTWTTAALLLLAGSAAAQLDMTGTWNVTTDFGGGIGTVTSPLTITQTGTTLTESNGGVGTIDPVTGEFELRTPSGSSCVSMLFGFLRPSGIIQGTVFAPLPVPTCTPIAGFFVGVRAPCGNGVLDPGEDCEGLTACCVACRFVPAGTACPNDGQACTADVCDGAGACTHPVLPAGTACAEVGPCRTACDGVGETCPRLPAGTPDAACGPCEACNGSGACASLPMNGCAAATTAGGGSLRAKRSADHARDRFIWKWAKGEATTLADFGVPELGGAAVCAWTQGGAQPLLTAPLIPSGASWRRSPTRLAYRNPSAANGISGVTMTPGPAGRSKIAVTGKGAGLGLPLAPLATPVVVQFQSNDRCWQSTFDAPSRNDAGLFRAKSD